MVWVCFLGSVGRDNTAVSSSGASGYGSVRNVEHGFGATFHVSTMAFAEVPHFVSTGGLPLSAFPVLGKFSIFGD